MPTTLDELLRDGDVVVHDGRAPSGRGPVVVRTADGAILVFAVRPEQPAAETVATAFPEGARLVDFEYERVRDPETGGWRWRIVVVVAEGTDEAPRLRVVVLDEDVVGVAPDIVRDGVCHGVHFNEGTGQKTVVFDVGDARHWLTVDLATGGVPVESTDPLTLEDELVDAERVGEQIVLIQRWRDRTWVRIRVYSLDGQLLHVIDIPGDFASATTNGRDLKAIATNHEGTVYQDLVDVTTPGGGGTPVVRPLPQNGIDGVHCHLQHDAVAGVDRFIEVVYLEARDETVIRVLDRLGRVLATHVIRGRYRECTREGDRKTFVVVRDGREEVAIVDLAGCALVHVGLPTTSDADLPPPGPSQNGPTGPGG